MTSGTVKDNRSKHVLFAKKTNSGLIWIEPHEAEDWYGTFLGESQNSLPHGHGIFISIDGIKYIGEWFSSSSGKGTFTWPSGKKFKGEWKSGGKHGIGITTFSNGDILKCRYKEGEIDGIVNLKFISGQNYVGQFKAGKSHGRGTLTLNNGEKYDGDWEKGLRDGNGIYYYKNGDTYDGEWKKDEFHGKGTYTWESGQRYVGDFKKGEINGRGKKTWPVDELSKFREDYIPGREKIYSGDFLNGIPHGFGTFDYQNGSSFSGKFYKGVKYGPGKLINSNGSIILEGHFIDGELEGQRTIKGDFGESGDYDYGSEFYESDENLSVWDLAPDGMGEEAWGELEYSDDESYSSDFLEDWFYSS